MSSVVHSKRGSMAECLRMQEGARASGPSTEGRRPELEALSRLPPDLRRRVDLAIGARTGPSAITAALIEVYVLREELATRADELEVERGYADLRARARALDECPVLERLYAAAQRPGARGRAAFEQLRDLIVEVLAQDARRPSEREPPPTASESLLDRIADLRAEVVLLDIVGYELQLPPTTPEERAAAATRLRERWSRWATSKGARP